jgi:phosphoribosylformylglycinamidine cyclo-ligase
LFDVGGYDVDSRLPELRASLGEELLLPHINYTKPVLHLLAKKIPIKGMAHITGGGVLENIPRILPANCAVEIRKHVCPVLPLFGVIQKLGQLDDAEMYRTFNMGIGLVMIVPPEAVIAMQAALKIFPSFPLYEIGRVVAGQQEVKLIHA